MRTSLLCLILLAGFSAQAENANFPFKGLEQSLTAWGVPTNAGKEVKSRLGRPVRVAILDKTFVGYEAELGKTIPANTQYFEGPVKIGGVDPSAHGLRMAQLFSFIATQQMTRPELVELRLYRVAGYSNFKFAIQDSIDWKADFVLHSEVWEVGGNYDGKGFLNAEVSRASKAGITWVNAAGNYEGLVYSGAIRVNGSRVALPGPGDTLPLVCKATDGKKCGLRALLTWNSFTDSTEDGVEEDLDFDLLDKSGKSIASSHWKQTTEPGEAKPGFSKYPREAFDFLLEPGTYSLQITAVTKKFRGNQYFRVSIAGEFLEMPFTVPNETMMNPADNPDVLTVGALDSDRSSLSKRMGKPEVFAPSSVHFSDGQEYRGSSNSAALVTGLLALKKTLNPKLDRPSVLREAAVWDWNRGSNLRVGNGMSPCFPELNPASVPAFAAPVLSLGAKLVQTAEGPKLLLPLDPLTFSRGLERDRTDDRVLWSARGWDASPRFEPVPAQTIEVFQVPADARLCRAPEASFGRILVGPGL